MMRFNLKLETASFGDDRSERTHHGALGEAFLFWGNKMANTKCRRSLIGKDSPSWKGGKYINDSGYLMVANNSHPRKQSNGYVREHILVAERALGKSLPHGVQIHHYGDTFDNGKMILCQNQEYHYLIHTRTKALKECGYAKWRKCKFCKEYDDPVNLHINHIPPYGWNIHHQDCESEYEKIRTAKRKKRNAVKGLSN